MNPTGTLFRRLLLATAAVALALLVAACGGGGGGSAPSTDSALSPPPAPGTPPAGLVSGRVTAVDQQSVVGWACYPGDANTKLGIELWAVDASTGGWIYVTSVVADRQRTDAGASGACGTGAESNYHGFELAVYPDALLTRDKTYAIYAFHRPTRELLAGGGRTVAFPESGLPTSSYWRTDFDDPNLRSPTLLGCVWPFPGANQRANTSDDPLWLDAAGGTWRYGPSAPLGFVTPSNWCIGFDPVHSNPPPAWSQSNSATNAPQWPTGNFWAVSVNDEPAYSQLNPGPPGQSLAVNSGVGFSISTAGDAFVLGLDNTQLPKDDAGNVILTGGTPFISIGAQMGRGSAGPLAFVDSSGPDTYVDFTATKNVEAGTLQPYHAVFLFIEAMWGGAKRMVVVTLQNQTTRRAHWNWNVYPSFYYPGAELNFVSVDDVVSRCSLQGARIPKMDDVSVAVPLSYSLPIRGLFQCIDSGRVAALGWTAPRPVSRPLFVSGLHLGIEQGPQRPDNKTQVTFSVPRLIAK